MTFAIEQRLGDLGISFTHFLVMKLSRETRVATVTEIALQLGHDTGATTRVTDVLEARGLVVRTRSRTDRRIVDVALTPHGGTIVARADAAANQFWHETLAHFSSEERAHLAAELDRLIGAFYRAIG